jgi:ribosomal protein S18 acetylase RimI-like enzyme
MFASANSPLDNHPMQPSGKYTLVRPSGDLALRGIRVLVGGPESAPWTPAHGHRPEIETRVKGFLDYSRFAGVDITHQVLALEPATTPPHAEIIAGMCLWVPAPGHTAMIFAPSQSEFPEAAVPTGVAVAAALEDARAYDIVLIQAMLEPADAAGKTVFSQAGLVQLATLTYMERKPPMHPPPSLLPADVVLEPYSAKTHALFREAIAESYHDTLDCPALSGMRDVDDVILGHKAVGPFDPQLWSVLLLNGQVAGCLLLSEIPARHGLELVYLGIAPFARGRGLGRAMMQRVLAIAARRHFEVATLAVDAANTPAVKLYRRCGYSSVAQRIALVKRLK